MRIALVHWHSYCLESLSAGKRVGVLVRGAENKKRRKKTIDDDQAESKHHESLQIQQNAVAEPCPFRDRLRTRT